MAACTAEHICSWQAKREQFARSSEAIFVAIAKVNGERRANARTPALYPREQPPLVVVRRERARGPSRPAARSRDFCDGAGRCKKWGEHDDAFDLRRILA